MNKSIAIIGATGEIGKHLLDNLIESEEVGKIHLISRRPLEVKNQKVTIHVTDFDLLETLELPRIDIAYCCLGTTMKQAGDKNTFYKVDVDYVFAFAKKVKECGTNAFSVVSAVSANPYSSNFYNKCKGEIEVKLVDLKFKSLQIFRPSLLISKRKELRVGEKMAIPLMKTINPLLRGKLTKYQAIEVQNVAISMFKMSFRDFKGVRYFYRDDML